VTYQYTVSNTGATTLTDIVVTDDKLGPIGTIDTLAGSADASLTKMTTITDTTVNIGTATVSPDCKATATVTVGKEPPPPCVVTGESTIKLDKKKLEWKIMNTGSDVATIDTIEITWPNGTNGYLDKVKVGGDEINSGNYPGPSATIDTFTGDPSKREIDPGQTVTIKFEFEHNVSKVVGDYGLIRIDFAESCSVEFDPANAPFDCKAAKPIDSLTMIWNGPDVGAVDVISPTGDTASGVTKGTEVTFTGLAPYANDVEWTIADAGAGVSGISTFHISCSDGDMNGPEDCGLPEGDGRDNNAGLNLWLFEGMAGLNGIALDCSALP